MGAGHAHLHIVRHAAVLRAAGVEPVLVAPPRFHYSGLATAVLSGALSADQAQIDIAALAAHFGVQHIAAEVTEIDRPGRNLRLADGQDLTFDAVSLNVGSVTPDPLGLGRGPDVWCTKPLTGLIDLRTRVESHIVERGASPAIVVAGGGPSGFEIAAALAGLAERNGTHPRIHLVSKSPATWAPRQAIDRLSRALQRRGIVLLNGEVVERQLATCGLSGGRQVPCDMLVLAAGLSAAPLIAALGSPLSDDGRLRVGPTQQPLSEPAIFAVGDCSAVEGSPRPAAGVFGVRAAPVLLHNLAALASGAPMRRYRPQRHWLSIMDLGDGTGLATRGQLWWMGRSMLALKRRIDLGFIGRMRAPSGEPLQN